ncbi:hypothetical protein HMPREF0742_02650 [Rothia aeria F0184]|uniref:Uncharacterized protein n=2 Tax=Rothia aeria TaxID=172042 RepID=U7UWK2_9MICC|nr:hypothetical protein HMPREF1324_1110 [Rothia aeria F0474]ERT63680.1 hypothetical protein HMPREF0742_02650 [Rothia aeria F0184]
MLSNNRNIATIIFSPVTQTTYFKELPTPRGSLWQYQPTDVSAATFEPEDCLRIQRSTRLIFYTANL